MMRRARTPPQDELGAAAADDPDPAIRWRSLAVEATWFVVCGDLDRAAQLNLEAADVAGVLHVDEVRAALAAQLLLIRMGQGRADELAGAFTPEVLRIPAARAAYARVCAETGRAEEAHRVVGDLLANPGVMVPEDATWPFGIGMLAGTAERLDHGPLARAVARSIEGLADTILAYPMYYIGPIAQVRASMRRVGGGVFPAGAVAPP